MFFYRGKINNFQLSLHFQINRNIMTIETKYGIGDKVEFYTFDDRDKLCTITSVDITVKKADRLEITYNYIRKKSKIEGRCEMVEDGKCNEIIPTLQEYIASQGFCFN
jgi:hypothetical protein